MALISVRKALLTDLETLVEFTAQEALEAEGSVKIPETLKQGVEAALLDPKIAQYWVLCESEQVVGSVSAIKEWSDWNAGYYWWIQSMYLAPSQRGKGRMPLLINAVLDEMKSQQGLELRLYVHAENRRAISAYERFGFSASDYQIMSFDNSYIENSYIENSAIENSGLDSSKSRQKLS